MVKKQTRLLSMLLALMLVLNVIPIGQVFAENGGVAQYLLEGQEDLTIEGGIGSASTQSVELLDNTRIVYTFHNTTLAEPPTNWYNFVVEVWGSTTFGITARADAYDWGYNGLDGKVLLTWEHNIDDDFASNLANADVTVIIDRVGNKVTLTYDIKSSGGKTYHLVGSTENYTLPDVVYTHLTGEQVKLSNIKVRIYRDDVYDPSKDDAIEYEAISNRVTVHDPSIVKDPETGYYYIFGSHKDWAMSTDLIHWQKFTNNINRNFSKIFAAPAELSARGGAQDSTTGKYEVSGNLWAPDVIWNDTMNKWCMIMFLTLAMM